MKVKLFADPACWEFAKKFPDEYYSFGCGPGGIGDYFVPDTVWGLCIKPACQVHDWYYRLSPSSSEADRERADRILYNNILRIIRAKGGKLQWLRSKRAKTYFNMVRWFGGPAYWEERNRDDEFKEIDI